MEKGVIFHALFLLEPPLGVKGGIAMLKANRGKRKEGGGGPSARNASIF